MADELNPVETQPETGGTDIPSTSLRDTLTQAFAESRETELADTQTEETRRRENRDPATGKFIPKTADAAPSAPVEQKSPGTDPAAKPAASDPAGPPPTWAADKKAAWNDLASLQKAVAKREEEFSSGIAQYQQRQKELDEVMGPREAYHPGVSRAQAINNLWLWFEALKNTPQESFPALAKSFGYDLSTVVPGAAGSQDSEFSDPLLQPLQRDIGQLRDTVGSLAQWQRSQEEQRQRENMSRAQTELDRIREEKGADGKPLRPHWDSVKTDMGYAMKAAAEAGKSITPQEAYDRVIWSNPQIRADLVAAERTKAALAPNPAASRRAAVSPRSSAPNGAANGVRQPSGKSMSIRESLIAAVDEHRG